MVQSTSEADTTTETAELAALPCAWCGVEVARPADPTRVQRQSLSTPVSPFRPEGPRTEARSEWGRCVDCVRMERAAAALVEAHPRMKARVGSGAGCLVGGVLIALELLGEQQPALDLPDAEFGLLVRHLGRLGWGQRWVLMAEAGSVTEQPWAQVDGEDRGRLRAAMAAVLAERTARGAPARRVDRPELGGPGLAGGCLLCGVGHVMVTAVDALRGADVWRETTVSPVGLGAHGPGTLRGLLCLHCDQAVQEVGAMGPTAAERSLVNHLRRSGQEVESRRLGREDAGGERVRLTGLRSWGSLAYAAREAGLPLPRPNSSPWGHAQIERK